MPAVNKKLGATDISLGKDIGSGVFSDMCNQLDGTYKTGWTTTGVSLRKAFDITANGTGWNGYDGSGLNGASIAAISGFTNSFIPYDITYPAWFSDQAGLGSSDLRNSTTQTDGHINTWDSRTGYYCLVYANRANQYLQAKLLTLTGTAALNNNPDSISLKVTQNISSVTTAMVASCTAVSPKDRPSEEASYSFYAYRNGSVSGYSYFGFLQNDYVGPSISAGTQASSTSYTNSIIPSACYAGVGTTAGYDVALFMRLKNNSGLQVFAVKRNNSNAINSSTSVNAHLNASNFGAGYNGGICADTIDGRFYGAYGEVYNSTSPGYSNNLTFFHGSITVGNGSGTPTLSAGTAFNLSTSNAVRAVNCDIVVKDDTYNWILVAYSKATDNNIYYHVVRHTRGTTTFSNFASGTLYNGADCNINQRIKVVSQGYHYITTAASATKQVAGKFTLQFVKASDNSGAILHGWFNTTTGTVTTATDDGTSGQDLTTSETTFPVLFRTDFAGNASRHIGLNATYTKDGLYQVDPVSFDYPGKGNTQLCVTNMFAGVFNGDVDDTYGAWYYQ